MSYNKTQNLSLHLPIEGSFGWGESLNHNFYLLDMFPGVLPCTSSTRPATPWAGQIIFETDTRSLMIYNDTFWHLIFQCPEVTP